MPEVEFEHGGVVWQASRVLDLRKPDCPMVLRVRPRRGQPAPTADAHRLAVEIADLACSPGPKKFLLIARRNSLIQITHAIGPLGGGPGLSLEAGPVR